MKVSVFGLGYVGCTTSGCLAQEGHEIIGVEINQNKVNTINRAQSVIIEEGIDRIIKNQIKEERLKATTLWRDAVMNSDISMICVGTPSDEDGNISLLAIENVSAQIGNALALKDNYHLVVVRSTVLPETTENVIIPIMEKESGKKVGKEFGICFHPEFLREGSSVYDFYHPAEIVIGEYDKRSGNCLIKLYEDMKTKISSPTIRTSIKTAEMIKYANNAFHAIKVAFANETGTICKKMGVDSREVMEIFCLDKKLNLSSYYLRPGGPFGGSCLPKDIIALINKSKHLDLNLPLLNSILQSNEQHLKNSIQQIIKLGKKNICILGFSFKPGTDDLRESPWVVITETLLGKGYKIKIYDKNISMSKIIGANKEYIETHIPHIIELLSEDIEDVVLNSDIVILANEDEEYLKVLEKLDENKFLFDFVDVRSKLKEFKAQYFGVCW